MKTYIRQDSKGYFSTAGAWLAAIRPKTLWVSISPVIIGSALAYGDGGFHLLAAIFTALCSLLIQIGTNLANDYFDYVHGIDTNGRLGPVRASQSGIIPPEKVRQAFMLSFALALLSGIYLVYRGGIPILLIGIVSILCGITYTAGPIPLSYTGLADIFAFLFFGPVAVAGTYYVQVLKFSMAPVIAGLAPGFFSVAILTVNNLRDINTDRKAGKRSLAVRFGVNFSRMEYLVCLLLALETPIVMLLFFSDHPYQIGASFLLFLAIPSLKIIFREPPGQIYNQVLVSTSRLMFIYSITFSAGWLL